MLWTRLRSNNPHSEVLRPEKKAQPLSEMGNLVEQLPVSKRGGNLISLIGPSIVRILWLSFWSNRVSSCAAKPKKGKNNSNDTERRNPTKTVLCISF
jgi:hypothetical protein